MGWLSFDDAEFCGQIYDLLKRLYRHSILEIGELEHQLPSRLMKEPSVNPALYICFLLLYNPH
jgi:hypothetical protein